MRRSISSASTSSLLPRQRLQVPRVSANIITFVIMFAVLAQSVAAMTTVVAIPFVTVPTGHWRSIVTAVTTVSGSFNRTLMQRLGFREFFRVFRL